MKYRGIYRAKMGTKQRFLGKKARRYIKRHSSTRRKSGGGSEGRSLSAIGKVPFVCLGKENF